MVEILTSIRIFVTNYTDHSVKHLYPAQIKFSISMRLRLIAHNSLK